MFCSVRDQWMLPKVCILPILCTIAYNLHCTSTLAFERRVNRFMRLWTQLLANTGFRQAQPSARQSAQPSAQPSARQSAQLSARLSAQPCPTTWHRPVTFQDNLLWSPSHRSGSVESLSSHHDLVLGINQGLGVGTLDHDMRCRILGWIAVAPVSSLL